MSREPGQAHVGSQQSPGGKPDGRRQGAVYQASFEAVMAILIAAGIGHLVDRQLGTAHWGAFIGLLVGFASFVLRLVRLGRKLYGPQNEGRDESQP